MPDIKKNRGSSLLNSNVILNLFTRELTRGGECGKRNVFG